MLLKGVRLFDEKLLAESDANEDSALVHPTEGDLPWETVRIMAACHSLAIAAMGRGNDKTPRLEVIGDPLEQAVMKDTGYRLIGNNVVAANDENSAGQRHKPISILHRFAFSSKLKRMTVLVTEEGGKGTIWALTKGAPETIKELLLKESIPFNYDDVSFHHMSRGRRVLAMAYREVGAIRNLQLLKDGGRDSVEQNLTFVGFMVLDCPLKPDSKSVISELKKSGHTVVMITGDAILTAAEVARQVGIIRRSSSGKRTVYRIEKRIDGGATNPSDPLSFFECAPLGSSAEGRATLELSRTKFEKLLRMSKEGEASFCISGDTLVNLASTAVQVDRSSALSTQSSSLDEKHLLMSPAAQSVLSKLVPIVSVFARHAPHQKEAVVAAFNHGGFQTLMCGDGTNDVGALKRAHVGISIISAPEVESKQREASAKISQAKANDKLERKSKSKSKRASRATTLEESLRQLREAQDELDQVELGDASVAAPFTSRAVSIKCCKDVIQQGRCTLVTMLQIYKILGINCLVNALVLSKLFLHGVKQGDRQLTILGVVVTLLFFFVTRAEPLSVLSPIRPPASVLCVQALVSISGQFLICLATILLATEAALFFVDPYDPSLVPDGPFNPNVLNTCTFLLTCLSTSKYETWLSYSYLDP
jgi:manganese-transporting P-type ATPase